MSPRSSFLGLFLIAAAAVSLRGASSLAIPCPSGCDACSFNSPDPPSVKAFPDGFLFGSATSATQVEGAALEDGRSASIWDVAASDPGFIKDGSNPSVATDEYHRLKEDIQLLANAGFKAYRFSISWSRVLPDGHTVNQKGIAYYNALIDELTKSGITPAATLYHWDLPEALHESYGGWLNATIVDDFSVFARLCFKSFGDRVPIFMTLNEPGQTAIQGYGTGNFAPRRCSDRSICSAGDSSTEPYLVGHHQLLAHAAAVQIYRSEFEAEQKGTIGLALDSQFYYPVTNSSADVAAAQRGMEFAYGWFADPVHTGDYPASMRQYVGGRLPSFTLEQQKQLKGSADFLGINIYTATYAQQGAPSPPGTPWQDSQIITSQTSSVTGQPIGASTASPWLKVVPTAMKDILLWISSRYNYPDIYVTENGSSDPNDASIPLNEALCDSQRVGFYNDYLRNAQQAIEAGVKLRGYFAWSLLDNWEWAQGFSQRFGLYFVDFSSSALTRYPKASVTWFSKFLSGQ